MPSVSCQCLDWYSGLFPCMVAKWFIAVSNHVSSYHTAQGKGEVLSELFQKKKEKVLTHRPSKYFDSLWLQLYYSCTPELTSVIMVVVGWGWEYSDSSQLLKRLSLVLRLHSSQPKSHDWSRWGVVIPSNQNQFSKWKDSLKTKAAPDGRRVKCSTLPVSVISHWCLWWQILYVNLTRFRDAQIAGNTISGCNCKGVSRRD